MGVVKRLEVGVLASFTLLVLACLILSASANGPTPLATVEIANSTSGLYESLTVLDPYEGNWIKLLGGENVSIPPVTLVYNGNNSVTHVEDSTTINVTSSKIQENKDYVVPYPFDSHPFYHAGDDVTVEVQLEEFFEAYEGQIYVYLVETGPAELMDAFSAGVHGDTAPIRTLFRDAREEEIEVGETATFYELEPGDYGVAALLYNSDSDYNNTLISVSALTVLEHESTLVPPEGTSFKVRPTEIEEYVDGEFTITDGSANAKYTYIAALIKNETYTVRLECDGTKAGTYLWLNNALLVGGFEIGGVGLNNVNSNTVYNWLKGASTAASVEPKTKTGNTYEFELPVEDFPDGDYFLYVAAWNVTNPSQRVVALSQTAVRIDQDLTLSSSDISFSSGSPTEGDSVSITATIHNIGGKDAGNFTVSFRDGTSLIGNDTISVNASSNFSASTTWTAVVGDHTITVVADSGKVIEEYNETNNEASRTISVNSRGGGGGGPGGGGGGGSPPAPTGITEIQTEPTGEVTSTVTASSADGKASITISEGIIAKDAAGNPLTQVTVSPPTTLPASAPSGTSYVGYAIDLGPSGARFSAPVKISITFDPADFPLGTTPVIYVFEAGAWKALPTTIVGNKAVAYVDHFSIFVLFAESAAPTPSPTSVVTPTAPPPVTPTVTPTATPTPLFTSLMLPPLNVVMVIVIALVVAVLNIAAYRMLRRRTNH
jgi:methanogen extracellular protein (TIGR04279 family)